MDLIRTIDDTALLEKEEVEDENDEEEVMVQEQEGKKKKKKKKITKEGEEFDRGFTFNFGEVEVVKHPWDFTHAKKAAHKDQGEVQQDNTAADAAGSG